MANYRDTIQSIEKEIAANDALISADHAAIGKALLDAHVDLSGSGALVDQAETATRLDRELSEIQSQTEKVDALLQDRETFREDIQAKETEIREHQESLPPIFVEIGAIAFQRFQENPFVDQEYVQLFSELVKHHEELRDAETELERIDGTMEQKPFLEKVVAKGKRIVVANRVAAKQNAERRLLRAVGKEVVGTDFIRSMDDPALNSVAKPYYDSQKRIENLEHDIQILRERDQQASEALTAIIGDQRPDRFVSDQQTRIEAHHKELNAAYAEIGKSVADGALSAVEADGNTEALVEEIRELKEANRDKRSHIERLSAALRVEELERQIQRREAAIEGLEEQIKSLDDQIAAQRQELATRKQEMAEQEKARGPAEFL